MVAVPVPLTSIEVSCPDSTPTSMPNSTVAFSGLAASSRAHDPYLASRRPKSSARRVIAMTPRGNGRARDRDGRSVQAVAERGT
jgi:hypothetical protein